VPVVKTEDIPPEDEGWLCPRCDARVDVIYVLNDEYAHDLDQKCVAADVFAREAEMRANGVVPGTAKFAHEHEEAWPSDESDDDDFDTKRASDDGEDDEDEALSGSARSSSDESSSSESESEELIIEGPRRRTKVDYVKLNSHMFGDDEAYEGEDDDRGWKSSNASKAEMLAAVKNRSKTKTQTKMTTTTKRATTPTASPTRSTRSNATPTKRPRIRFDDKQKAALEAVFAKTRAPPTSERDRLARELDVDPSSVRIWFMNRRRRDRVSSTRAGY
jgi:hypothetical protein